MQIPVTFTHLLLRTAEVALHCTVVEISTSTNFLREWNDDWQYDKIKNSLETWAQRKMWKRNFTSRTVTSHLIQVEGIYKYDWITTSQTQSKFFKSTMSGQVSWELKNRIDPLWSIVILLSQCSESGPVSISQRFQKVSAMNTMKSERKNETSPKCWLGSRWRMRQCRVCRCSNTWFSKLQENTTIGHMLFYVCLLCLL